MLPSTSKKVAVDQRSSLYSHERDDHHDNKKEHGADDGKGHDPDTVKTAAWSVTSVWDVMLVRLLLSCSVLVYRHDFVSMVIRRFNSSVAATGYMSSLSSIISTCAASNSVFNTAIKSS